MTAIIVAVTIAAVTAWALLMRDGAASRSEAPLGSISAALPGSGSTGQARLDRIVAWVDGIVAGRILRADLAARAWSTHPADTMRVRAASASILSLTPAGRASAMAWIRGLANRSIIWRDVNAHLRHQEPKVAEVVTKAWFAILGLHAAAYPSL